MKNANICVTTMWMTFSREHYHFISGTCSSNKYECYPGLCYDQEGECICNNGVDTLDTDRSAGDCLGSYETSLILH